MNNGGDASRWAVIDSQLRYPLGQTSMPDEHASALYTTTAQPYGLSMRRVIAMPLSYADDHPGAHVQVLDPHAFLKSEASMVEQPFHTTVMHRVFSNDLTEKTIREQIVPELCERFKVASAQAKENPVTIETHYDPETNRDAAKWDIDPNHATVRFLGTKAESGHRCFVITIDTRSNRAIGQELLSMAEQMKAQEYATNPRVQWAKNLQARMAGRLLDTCAQVVEKHVGRPIADRVPDDRAKQGPYEVAPLLAQYNGPMNVTNTVRYVEPQYAASKPGDIQDPNTRGKVLFYVNCAGEASKGALLMGNHNDCVYEMFGSPEPNPNVTRTDGSVELRSPVNLVNAVFNAQPSFQPRRTEVERQRTVDAYREYPSQQEDIHARVVSVSGQQNAETLGAHFSRFRVPTEEELKTATCPLSKQAFNWSGGYQRYDPIVSIVP